MHYKKFGNTGFDVSVIGVGTFAIGGYGWGESNREDSIAAIRAMIDRGVNLIDTAPAYNYGYAERVVGEAVRGMRDKVFLVSKCGSVFIDGVGNGYARNNGYRSVLKECDEILSRLGTDYLDLLVIHWPDPGVPIEETMRALNELRAQGKIRFSGASNFNRVQVEEAQKYGQIAVIQPGYSMLSRGAEPLMRWAAGAGIGTMTYGSLGAGMLTGAFRTPPRFDADDFRYNFYDYFVEPKFSRCMKLLEVLDGVAAAHDAPVAQVAINWSTQKPFLSTALLGVRNAREAEENCAGLNWSLSDGELSIIDSAIDQYIGMGSIQSDGADEK